jgi:hypothetical protein
VLATIVTGAGTALAGAADPIADASADCQVEGAETNVPPSPAITILGQLYHAGHRRPIIEPDARLVIPVIGNALPFVFHL